ncbi:peptide chain release factor 3 [Salmonella enterica subsp. enterica]|uniref:Peptide chain release factor 3 n=1 Tax=Salmonella enterica I TaxID=59201 RepID=A0A447MYR1_SALET|nr:peptide chain release factor 3 [Salmonella enterica subsp. enterica]
MARYADPDLYEPNSTVTSATRWSLLDEVENELKIGCAPITWPIGLRQAVLRAFITFIKMKTYLYQTGKGHTPFRKLRIVKGLNNPDLDAAVGEDLAQQAARRAGTGAGRV